MTNSKDKIFYKIDHLTEIEYSSDVLENHFVLTMQPVEREGQKILSYKLKIEPKVSLSTYQDHYGNNKTCFNILEKHSKVRISSSFRVEIVNRSNSDIKGCHSSWEELEDLDMHDWLKDSYFAKTSPLLKSFLKQEKIEKKKDPLSSLIFLNSRLYEVFHYSSHATHAESSIDEILTSRKGVCQDYAHVMISIARLWGIPARYVSGYLYMGKGEDKTGVSAQTHAWCEFYLPSLGWLGFDPTNNMLFENRHIVTAIGRDYKDVPPHYGVFKGSQVQTKQIIVQVHVEKLK